MFRIEWTPHKLKSRQEFDENFSELQESIAIDGPTDFAATGRAELIDHFAELRRTFARSAAAHDPRFGQYDPIRRWLEA